MKVEVEGSVSGQVAGGDIHNYGPVIFHGPTTIKQKIVLQPGSEHIE